MNKKIRDLKVGDRFKFNEWCTWEQVESQPHPADSDRPDRLWVFNTVSGHQYQSPENLVIVKPND